MPLIKIIITENNYSDDYSDSHRVTQSITDWEEISQEDLDLLSKYRWDLMQSMGLDHAHNICILQKDTEPAVSRIRDLKEIIKAKLARAEAARLKRSAAAKLSKDNRLASRRAKELETLTKLQEKYGS